MTPERLPRRFRNLDGLQGPGAYARQGALLLRLSPTVLAGGIRPFEIIDRSEAVAVRSAGAIDAQEQVSPDALLAEVLALRARKDDLQALLDALSRGWLCTHLRLGNETPFAASIHLSTALATHLYLLLYRPHGPGSARPDLAPADAIYKRRKRTCPTPLRRLLLRVPDHKTWPGAAMPPAPTTGHARLHWETVRQEAIADATAAAGRLGVALPAWKELIP